MAKVNQLSALKVDSIKEPGRYCDGLGLWLEVRRDTGSKSWVFRYMIDGQARSMGLGPLHSVNLKEARERARLARQVILDGRDPIEAKRAAKLERMKVRTFRQAVNEFLSSGKVQEFKNDKHRKQWRSTLEKAFPLMGDLPLQEIDSDLVLEVLKPILARTPETGSRLRGRIERIFDWATPLKYFQGDNPARREILKDHLPKKPKATHHKAVPYAELPALMGDLRKRDSLSAKAVEFSILTAARTNETIGATWDEIDLKAKVWTVPAERMKADREHRVPLSAAAVKLLKALPKNGDRIFKLSNMAMLELLRGLAGNGYTVHGFRSSFSDWARDKTEYPRDVVEMALAHKIKDKSEAAYRRGDALDKRRKLMADWAKYCGQRA